MDNITANNQMTEFDFYPSRNGEKETIIPRKDPVVYAAKGVIPPITPLVIEQYEKQGFVVLDDIFSPEEICLLQQESERLRADEIIQQSNETITESGSSDVRSIFRVHDNSPIFKQLSVDERLVGLARYLLADEIYIHQSRLNYKPGFRGKEFYWHSDFETWHVEDGMPRMRALSMSITLTENYPDNGPLMIIPSSHRQYVSCEGKTPENHHLASLQKQECGIPSDNCLQTMVERGGIVALTSKPGSVIIFDCNVMHGSNNNITPFPRSNIFFVYNAQSNKVIKPFCTQAPRPEHICTRKNINPIQISTKAR